MEIKVVISIKCQYMLVISRQEKSCKLELLFGLVPFEATYIDIMMILPACEGYACCIDLNGLETRIQSCIHTLLLSRNVKSSV